MRVHDGIKWERTEVSVLNVTRRNHCWFRCDIFWLIDHLEDWGGLGRTGEDWGGLGRTGEDWKPPSSKFIAVQTNSKSAQSQLVVP